MIRMKASCHVCGKSAHSATFSYVATAYVPHTFYFKWSNNFLWVYMHLFENLYPPNQTIQYFLVPLPFDFYTDSLINNNRSH